MPGFDVNRFVGLDDWLAEELVCAICLCVYSKAIDTQCGHTFCSECIQRTVRANSRSLCPQCRQELNPRKRLRNAMTFNEPIFKDNRKINSIISKLNIKCDFESKGCNEIMELCLLSGHLEKCAFNLCNNCGLKVGKLVEHNCLELMKTERTGFRNGMFRYKHLFNEMKTKYRELELKYDLKNSARVEMEIDDNTTEDNRYRSLWNDCKYKLNESETKCNEFLAKISELEAENERLRYENDSIKGHTSGARAFNPGMVDETSGYFIRTSYY